MFLDNRAHEGFRLARRRSVADRNTSYTVLLHKIENDLFGTFEVLFRLCWIDCLVLEKFSGGVDDSDLATSALPRIDSDHTDLPRRWSKQQRPQIFLKDADGFGLCSLAQCRSNLILYRREQEPLIRVPDRTFKKRCKLGLTFTNDLRDQV